MPKLNYLEARAKHVAFYTDSPIVIEGENSVVYLYDVGYFAGIAYQGRRSKPDYHYRFSDEQSARVWAKNYNNKVDIKIAEALQRKKESDQERLEAAKSVKVGDIYYASWGYDQTNIDFYMVLSKTPKTVKVVKIPSVNTNVSDLKSGSSYVVPADINVNDINPEDIEVKRINRYGGFRVASYANAQKWDGQPQYETASGWGH